MPCFPRDLEDQAVRETQGGTSLAASEGALDDVGILEGQGRMHQQHLDCGRDASRRKIVNRVQDLDQFSKHQVGNPRAGTHERLRCGDLSRVISDDQPDEKIRVNGAHGAAGCTSGSRP